MHKGFSENRINNLKNKEDGRLPSQILLVKIEF